MNKREKILSYFFLTLIIASIAVGVAFFLGPVVIILSDVGNPYHLGCSSALVLTIICFCLVVLATRRARPDSRLGRAKKKVDIVLGWGLTLIMVTGGILLVIAVATVIGMLLGIYSTWFVMAVAIALAVLFVIIVEKGLDGSEQQD